MNKKFKIFGTFILYVALLYWLTIYLVEIKVKNDTANSGVFDSITIGIFYSVSGLSIYFFIINLTAVAGLIISMKRKDKIETLTFRILTALTVMGTVIFYLGQFVL